MFRLLFVTVVVAYFSLFPWHFDAASHPNPLLLLLHSWPEHCDVFTARDALLNVLLYLPLGAAAWPVLANRCGRRRAIAISFVYGAVASIIFELLQAYIPGRVTSLLDVVCNTAGSAAGAVAALSFRSFNRSGPPEIRYSRRAPVILLVCCSIYHLFPFLPVPSWERVRFEMRILLHPCATSYCCCSYADLVTGIWHAAAGWFLAGLAVNAVFSRMKPWWIAAALGIRLALRPVVITRPLGPDEVLGALAALVLWATLPERHRLGAGIWILLPAVLLRELAPFHLSRVREAFSWIPFLNAFESGREATALSLVRDAFHYGGILWLWRTRGKRYCRSGLVLAAALALVSFAERYVAGRSPSTTEPVLALLVALILSWTEEDPDDSGPVLNLLEP